MFSSKAEAYPSRKALVANIRPTRKRLSRTNTPVFGGTVSDEKITSHSEKSVWLVLQIFI